MASVVPAAPGCVGADDRDDYDDAAAATEQRWDAQAAGSLAGFSPGGTTILMEKRARKVAEDDALKLYNRVRQLHKEEDRAERRIADTRRRAKEIVRHRRRNELRVEEKELRLQQLAEDIELQKACMRA